MNGDPEVLGAAAEDAEFEALHDPFAIALAKAFHDVGEHYLPWPDSLKPCPDWIRHLAIMEAVAADPRLDVARDSRPVGEGFDVAAAIASFRDSAAFWKRAIEDDGVDVDAALTRAATWAAAADDLELRLSLQAGPAAVRPVEREGRAESEGDYVRRMFGELRRRLVTPPEHGADAIDAAIGYALNDCEKAVMDALYASNAGLSIDTETRHLREQR